MADSPHRVKKNFLKKVLYYISLDAKFLTDHLLTKDYALKVNILEVIQTKASLPIRQ